MTLKAIDGRTAGIKSARDEILDKLRMAIAAIEAGEIEPSMMVLVVVQDDLDRCTMRRWVEGRYASVIGIVEAAKVQMIEEMLD